MIILYKVMFAMRAGRNVTTRRWIAMSLISLVGVTFFSVAQE